MRELIAERKVTQAMFELSSLTDELKDMPEYNALRKELRKKGYRSIEDYLNRSLKSDKTRSDSELLTPILQGISNLKYPLNRQKPHPWKEVLYDAANNGLKLHFIDKNYEPSLGEAGSVMHDRNKYMAKQINKNPELNAPGSIGLFGAEHFKKILKKSDVKPGLHQLANIDEGRTWDLSPAFHDWQMDEIYPRWPELNRGLNEHTTPRQSGKIPFTLDTGKKPSLFHRKPYYTEASYKNTLVFDRANTPASAELATRILNKHPENTVVFTDHLGVIDYREGSIPDESREKYNDKKTKVYILRKPDQPSASTEQIRADIKRKFGHEMATLKVKEKEIASGAGTVDHTGEVP